MIAHSIPSPLRFEDNIMCLSRPELDKLKQAILNHVDVNSDITEELQANVRQSDGMLITLGQIEEQASVVYDIKGEMTPVQPDGIAEPKDNFETDSGIDDTRSTSDEGSVEATLGGEVDRDLVVEVTECTWTLPDDVREYHVNTGDITYEEPEDEIESLPNTSTSENVPSRTTVTFEVSPIPGADGPLVDGAKILELCSSYRDALESSETDVVAKAASTLQEHWTIFAQQRFCRVAETVWNIKKCKESLANLQEGADQHDSDHASESEDSDAHL